MTRPLIHPLRDGGSLTRVQPGRWERVQRPNQVAEIELTENVDRTKRAGISSIPSPWARLQLFRDALVDERHPSHEDVVNDVLDALEIVLFQRMLQGLRLDPRVVTLSTVRQKAREQRKDAVARFAETLQELAPEVGRSGGLAAITLVMNGDRLLFATSPFTLVFTPEDVRADLPGYFQRGRAIRPLADRPPLLAAWVRDSLLPQIGRSDASGLPEMQALRTLLERQLADCRDVPTFTGHWVDAQVHPAEGISLQFLERGALDSALAIAPTRTIDADRLPLVLDDSGAPAQRRYFSWLPRPAHAAATAAASRHVLPGTSWVYDWINPEHDFLAERLIVLDAPLWAERVHGVAGGPVASRVLLPLTRRFFEYYRAEDVARMVTLRVEGSDHDPVVHLRLAVPTRSGQVVVEREYRAPARIGAAVSLWPDFVTAEAPEWRDYYVALFLEGEDAGEALELEAMAGGHVLRGQAFQRDLSTLVQHVEHAPECIFVRQKTRTIGDARRAEGVILPKLRVAPPARRERWTVAIDFGTSNTVVAYDDGTKKSTLATSEGTRLDLTRTPEESAHVGAVLDTFFFPPVLDGAPFGTVMLRSLSADRDAPASHIPAVTANVPFSGNVNAAAPGAGGRHANEIVGDLKWGGGGADGERLTKLFLHQVLQVVHAAARSSGVPTDNMHVRWSYPSAFSPRKRGTTQTRWEAMLREFDQARLRLTPAAGMPSIGPDGARVVTSRDESTASMLYLRTDPAARGGFGPNSPYVKLTADVGGGTTDVAAYANGGIVFRNSILLGGRDLVSEPAAGMAQPGIFTRVHEWAVAHGMPASLQRVVGAYPSHHARFSYLVRQPWFAQRRGELSGEPWFPAVQACILYFFGTIHYNIGLQLRSATASAQGELRPPDLLFFGGNGSGYLHWLTEFRSWNDASSRDAFGGFLQKMLEAGYGKPLGDKLEIRTSSRPKHEVALGLLEDAGSAMTQDVRTEPPVGEAVTLPGDQGATSTYEPEGMLPSAELGERGVARLRYARPFDEWEIARFNAAFGQELGGLATSVDPAWRGIHRRFRELSGSLNERFYYGQVMNALEEHLRKDDIGAVTVFVLEATATLRRLEQELVGA